MQKYNISSKSKRIISVIIAKALQIVLLQNMLRFMQHIMFQWDEFNI